MHTDDFDFALPSELIAQEPLPQRDASRLLHIHRGGGAVVHRMFAALPSLLNTRDLLVFNDTRVIPARLLGHKVGTGGKVELLLVRPMAGGVAASALQAREGGSSWLCLGQASKGLKVGARLEFMGGLHAEVQAALGEGACEVRFTSPHDTLEAALLVAGRVPLPPYITRAPTGADLERYQTVFARQAGSVAAPTAGLHFTQQVLSELDSRGVKRAFVTLDVGPGTFMPVRDGAVDAHQLHAERYEVPDVTAHMLASHRAAGGRVVAVGTTVARTLEAASGVDGVVRAGAGETRIFIRPGYRFHVVGSLLTNLHLPKSTLLMLVCALVGRERALSAYSEAVGEGYRFFSYGDAMFIDGAEA